MKLFRLSTAQRFFFSVLLLGACTSHSPLAPQAPSKQATKSEIDPSSVAPTVILISIDGFRPDYLNHFQPQHLLELQKNGASADFMRPVFPSLTFPNHYSLITGLYPEEHGIVANEIKDAEISQTFNIKVPESIEDTRWWSAAEPLWIAAKKQGQKSATMFWPGSDVAIQGERPSYWRKYQGSVSNTERVQQVLNWIDLPTQERPTFLTLYFSDVDSLGHKEGPQSPKMAQAVKNIDDSIGQLMLGLEQRKISDKVNIVVVSDHGMTEIAPDHNIAISKLINIKQVDTVESGAIIGIYPKEGISLETVYLELKKAAPKEVTFYRRNQIPKRFHYSKNKRIPPILGVAKLGWFLSAEPRSLIKGTHGYDNQLEDMKAFFVAAGPGFKTGAHIKEIQNVDIYNLVCQLLHLKPSHNEGHLKTIRPLLKNLKVNKT